jgi:hypothetical protein
MKRSDKILLRVAALLGLLSVLIPLLTGVLIYLYIVFVYCAGHHPCE